MSSRPLRVRGSASLRRGERCEAVRPTWADDCAVRLGNACTIYCDIRWVRGSRTVGYFHRRRDIFSCAATHNVSYFPASLAQAPTTPPGPARETPAGLLTACSSVASSAQPLERGCSIGIAPASSRAPGAAEPTAHVEAVRCLSGGDDESGWGGGEFRGLLSEACGTHPRSEAPSGA